MKKLILLLASVFFMITLNAQDAAKAPAGSAVTPKATAVGTQDPATAPASVAGETQHATQHKCGEKGHKCSASCKHHDAAGSKEHVCTEACHKAGKCVYAHGEKGHKCTKACEKGKS